MAQIFNKAALERLQSPEQLDNTVKITSPLSWLVLVALTIIVGFGCVWAFIGTIPITVETKGIITAPSGVIGIYAPESGSAVSFASPGIVIGAESDNNYIMTYIDDAKNQKTLEVASLYKGIISNIVFQADGNNPEKRFTNGTELFRITPIIQNKNKVAEDKILVAYVPAADIGKINIGNTVKVYSAGSDSNRKGYMTATVIHIDTNVTSSAGFASAGITGEGASMQYVVSNGQQTPVYAVICELKTDSTTASGYAWSNSKGAAVVKVDGTVGKAQIVTGTVHPIDKMIDGISEFFSLGK